MVEKWSKNGRKSYKETLKNFFPVSHMTKAAMLDMEMKLSNSTFDWSRFHQAWKKLLPALRVGKEHVASGDRTLCPTLTEWARGGTSRIKINFYIIFIV